jgi:hypothetical protein
MKKLVSTLFNTCVVPLLVLLAGCDGSQQQLSESAVEVPVSKQSQPQQQVTEVLRTFIDASIARDYQAYYQLLSEQDKAVRSLADFVEEKQAAGVTLADAFYAQINYHIEDVVIDNGRARVVVEYRYPNVEYMIKDMFGLSILSDFTQDEMVKMKAQLEQAYQDKPVPMKASTRHFVLLQEAPGWRVLLGWKKSSEK